MLISAVVCTRNRSAMAVRAVQSLIDQTADPSLYEILIIDNGSTDDTKERIQELADATSRVAVRYEVESRTGIAFARNAGYQKAHGEYIAFIDDDAAAEPDWLQRAVANIQSADKPPIALGGKILPLYEVPKPNWFLDRYEERTWGEERRFLGPDESFSASNMVISRQAFIDVDGFPTDVGMSGEKLMIGEEPLVFERFWNGLECEGRVIYDPEMKVRHSIPAHKLKLTARAGRTFVAGQFNAFMLLRAKRNRLDLILRALVGVFLKTFVALFLIFKSGHIKRWIYEGLAEVAEPIGRLLALVGIKPNVRRL